MKKVFISQKVDNGSYMPYLGNPSELISGAEFEDYYGSPTFLIWTMLEPDLSIIPMILFEQRALKKEDFNTELLRLTWINDNRVRISDQYEPEYYVDIDIKNLKDIWDQYSNIIAHNPDKFVISREGDIFSIHELL